MQLTDSDRAEGPDADFPTPRVPSEPSVLDVLTQQPGLSDAVRTSIGDLSKLLVPQSDTTPLFLTVLLRTQGRRSEALKDALLCLSAQTVQAFEVIVIDHDSDEVGKQTVIDAVNNQTTDFRARIRIVEMAGGGRSAPLNRGVKIASGRYVAIFDDDDLLFGNWVEEFHNAEARAAGRVMRARTAVQQASMERWSNGADGYRSTSWPHSLYAPVFDQLEHLRINHSPFMSMAFPITLFTQLGFSFDEELPVCEDWDLILRASLLVGVADVDALTALYRRWGSAATSYTQHSKPEWLMAETRVIDRLDEMSITLPPGSARRLRSLIRGDDSRMLAQYNAILASSSWRYTAAFRWLASTLRRVRNAGGSRPGVKAVRDE